MKLRGSIPLTGPAIVAFGLLAGTALALWVAWSDVELVRVLATTPRATLAAPRQGPAIYSGKLFAAVDRATPTGEKSALYFAWSGKTGKYRRTYCSELASDKLVLRDGAKQASVELFADRNGVSLLADGRSEWAERRIIDLGHSPLYEGDVPATLPRCQGNNASYQQRSIPEGSEVEIFACALGDELRECDGPFAGILGYPTLEVHTWRRAQRAHGSVRVLTVTIGLALVALAVLASRMRKERHSSELRPEHQE